MTCKNYNFHNLVSLTIHSEKNQYLDYFGKEFSPCAVPKEESYFQSDIEVIIDNEFKSLSKSNNILKFDHYFCNLFHVQYSIDGLHNPRTKINFKGDRSIYLYPPIMGTFLQTSIIEPVIYLKSLWKRCVLVHSACVSNGKQAYLFVASGGSGKTTTALQLVHRRFQFLSDDLTFVTHEGMALPYPRPLHLFSYVLKGLPFLQLSPGLRFTLRWKDIIRSIASTITREKFYVATRVPLSQVLPDVQLGGPVPITKVFLLTSSGKLTRLESHKISHTQLAHDIAAVGDINAVLCDRLIANQPELVTEVRRREHEVLQSCLSHVSEVYEMNPRAFDETDWENFADQLREESFV